MQIQKTQRNMCSFVRATHAICASGSRRIQANTAELAKTCAKLGINLWDYLGSRLTIPGSPSIPYLPELVSAQLRPP
jgi:hypothetical protein